MTALFIAKEVFSGTEYRSRKTGTRYIIEPDDGFTVVGRTEDYTHQFFDDSREAVLSLIETADSSFSA